MKYQATHSIINILIATVWLVNGLYCKVLNLVPRHQEIVGRIIGNESEMLVTKIIGFAEMAMSIWIWSGIKTKLNVIVQILLIAAMNTIEFLVVPDLLLWGKFNSLFAFLFILVIYGNEFMLNKKSATQTYYV